VFLAPGDRLSFERIDRIMFDRINRAVEAGIFDAMPRLANVTSSAHKRGHPNAIAQRLRQPGRLLE
jgi:hypothetical protein